MWPASGEPGHRESIDTECVGELGKVVRPVEQPAARLVGREAEAWSIDTDESDAVARGRVGQEAGFESCAGMAMKIEEGLPARSPCSM
jgi:hypothetical protein